MALDAAGFDQEERESLSQAEIFRLHEECRVKKEALHPNTKKIVVDLGQVRDGWAPVSVPADEFYSKCRPLLDESIRATEALLAANPGAPAYETVVVGRGPMTSASASEVRDRDFELRPRGSPNDILRVIPGLVTAQHQGGGKADQLFLRGFDADHGTDVAVYVDDVPVNLP